MAGAESDETRALLDETQKPSFSSSGISNPIRRVRLLSSRQRMSRGTSNDGFVQEINNADEPTSYVPAIKYGYLEHIQSLKSSFIPENKSLSKKVKAYYEGQLELITSIEDILVPKSDETKDHATVYEKRYNRKIKILTMVTLVTNIILVVIKIIGAVISRSLSVISSVVDSVVDLLTNVILIWTARKIKKRDAYKYPGGRTRLEPVAIVVLSVIMCSASVQVIFESAKTLDQDIEYFTHQNDNSSTYTLPHIDMSIIPIVSMALTIISKAILLVLCNQMKNPTMSALAEDNRNDVASNIMALACGLIATFALQDEIKREAIVVDPIGAIIISVYIIIAWILQANRQIRHLTGLSAEPHFLQRLTHLVYNYRPDVVTKIDSIQAFHLGTNFFVEVDIGLPGAMPLSQAHDIGAELQKQLESIDDIERAFVHLDFEFSHMPACEHKMI